MSELLRGLKSSGKTRTCKVVAKKVKAGFIEPMLLLPRASLPADLGSRQNGVDSIPHPSPKSGDRGGPPGHVEEFAGPPVEFWLELATGALTQRFPKEQVNGSGR